MMEKVGREPFYLSNLGSTAPLLYPFKSVAVKLSQINTTTTTTILYIYTYIYILPFLLSLMKISRLFSIDQEIAERLAEEKNQSGIINELLKEYYSVAGSEEDGLKNGLKEAYLAIVKAGKDKQMLENRIAKIQKVKDKLRQKYKNIPEMIIEDFKHYPKMDVETLKVRFDGIYKHKFINLSWTELLKAWRMWHGIR